MLLSKHGVGTYPETRNLLGNIRPQSSQLAEPLWADPGIKSTISVRELISTSKKKKKKKGGERMVEYSPQNSRKREDSHQVTKEAISLLPQSPFMVNASVM